MPFVWPAICIDHLQWTSSCWEERNYADFWYITLFTKISTCTTWKKFLSLELLRSNGAEIAREALKLRPQQASKRESWPVLYASVGALGCPR